MNLFEPEYIDLTVANRQEIKAVINLQGCVRIRTMSVLEFKINKTNDQMFGV